MSCKTNDIISFKSNKFPFWVLYHTVLLSVALRALLQIRYDYMMTVNGCCFVSSMQHHQIKFWFWIVINEIFFTFSCCNAGVVDKTFWVIWNLIFLQINIDLFCTNIELLIFGSRFIYWFYNQIIVCKPQLEKESS